MGGAWTDWLIVVVAGAIAWHGLTWREATGERSWVHLLMGGIALAFCLRALFVDILVWA